MTYNGRGDDNRYTPSNTRPANYDPDDWNGEEGATNENVISNTRPVQALPFEAIECVAGVIIYDAEDFSNAGYSFAGGGAVDLGSAAGTWLQDNGESLFFSPHTGTPLYDEED